MNRLIAVGVALALLGTVLLAITLGRAPDERRAPLPDGPASGEIAATFTGPVPAMVAIAAGLSLAAGAGLIGIGANRWYAYRDRPMPE